MKLATHFQTEVFRSDDNLITLSVYNHNLSGNIWADDTLSTNYAFYIWFYILNFTQTLRKKNVFKYDKSQCVQGHNSLSPPPPIARPLWSKLYQGLSRDLTNNSQSLYCATITTIIIRHKNFQNKMITHNINRVTLIKLKKSENNCLETKIYTSTCFSIK